MGLSAASGRPQAEVWSRVGVVMQPSLSIRARAPAVPAASKAGCMKSAWPPRPAGTTWARRHAGPVCSYRQPGESRLETRGLEAPLEAYAEYTRNIEVSAPPASMARAVYAAQPGQIAQQALRARGARGLTIPGALVVLVLTVGAAVWTALQQRLRAVRECKACRGYGIQRCKLCNGTGRIAWEGKMAHEEPCPMCLGRRHTKCTCCGGHFARATFMHLDASGDAALLKTLAGLDPNVAADGAKQQQGRQRIIEEMDALANEIMAD